MDIMDMRHLLGFDGGLPKESGVKCVYVPTDEYIYVPQNPCSDRVFCRSFIFLDSESAPILMSCCIYNVFFCEHFDTARAIINHSIKNSSECGRFLSYGPNTEKTFCPFSKNGSKFPRSNHFYG